MIGLYPMTGKLRTWTIAECVALALDSARGDLPDPLPDWVRDRGRGWSSWRRRCGPSTSRQTGARSQRRPRSAALRRGLRAAADHGVRRGRRRLPTARCPAARAAGGLLDAFDARLPFTLTAGPGRGQRADHGRAGPAAADATAAAGRGRARARPWSRCGRCSPWSTPVARPPCWRRPRCWPPSTPDDHPAARRPGRAAGLLAPPSTRPASSCSPDRCRPRRSAKRRCGRRLRRGRHRDRHPRPAQRRRAVRRPRLVVVDEQHRFGVEQRAALSAKADARPHVLVMTATPIPRSVAMTVFGDLETSTLREIPAGRADVSAPSSSTPASQPGWVDRAWQRIVEEVGQGRQAYVVCARISSPAEPARLRLGRPEDLGDLLEPDEDLPPAAAVEDLYAELSARAAGRRSASRCCTASCRSEEKDAVMARFVAGRDRRAGRDHGRRGRGRRAERHR